MRQSHGFPVAAAIKSVITMIKSKQPLPRVDKGAAVPLLLLLFMLFLLAFAIRAIFPDTSYFFWDETVYMMHGRLFAGQEVGYSETFLRPPLLPLLLSPFARLESYELASRLFLALLNSLIVFPVYYLTKAIFNQRSAIVAAVVVAVLPVHILNSRWVMTDALGALLAFSSITSYLIGFKTEKKLMLYAGGVLAGLAVLMKFTNLLLLVLLLPLLLANARKRLANVAVSVALSAIVILPYLVFNAMGFGSPFYTFGRAFHVVAEQETAGFAGLGFLFYLLKDALGIPLMVFLSFGVAFSVFSLTKRLSQSQWKPRKGKWDNWNYQPYMLYCLFVTLAYSLFIVGRGVSKPFGLEWEAERFMLLFLLFAVPFIGHGIVRLLAIFRQRLPIAAIIVVAITLSLYPQLFRAYAPAVVHEDGLRQATRDMGMFLRNSSVNEFSCAGNCPPLAYYSGKGMGVYYSVAGLAAANRSAVIVFDDSMTFFQKEGQSRNGQSRNGQSSPNREHTIGPRRNSDVGNGYSVVKEFCSGSHCAYLFALSR
ncbi:glycosyltransferase family 39 protein [Candidatus Woesearchaeota archaeon]|nr:glycosyltransferase family 39 protein [Candidatus Woesearchaeota archaeon]